jgi:SdrD B-like domain
MATRFLGPTGSRRRRRLLTGSILLTLLVGLMFIGTAAAVHDEAFELDGNIAKANPVGGPEVDWDNDIVGVGANGFSVPQTSLPAGFSAATAGPDFTTTIRRGVEVPETGDDTTFTTNSKDILDIHAQWRCVHANNVTDKGDLVNTYAVAYVNSANQLILYFGAEKNDASGTNDLGVWFLQDPTVDCSDTQGGNGTAFTGSHVVGDILVVSEFSNGGLTATITAYAWDPTNPQAVNNLVQLSGGPGQPAAGRCDQIDSLGLDDRLCAITNVSNQVNPPWKTWDKDTGSLDFIDTQQFYEGAINVSAFGLNPCISTVLTDTRSSTSTTATLYDYARRSFNVCNSKRGTKFHDLNANGVRDTGEPGLSGWTINLYQDTAPLGSYNGEAVSASDVTDANGAYSFDNLFSGNYIVCEVQQSGWQQSAPTSAPSGETLVTNCPPGTGKGYAFTMSGSDRNNNDFGNFQQGTISGTKFKDRNDNGAKDAGEFGLSGWKIHVYNSAGTEVTGSPVTTDNSGNYSINVNPGTYTVCEEITDHSGWVQSYPTAATTGSASCTALGASLAARGWSVTLVSQGTTSLRDFGNTPLSQVQVNFLPQAKLPDGTTDATHATAITCTPGGGNTNSNTFTTSNLRISQGTTITCTITYVDP